MDKADTSRKPMAFEREDRLIVDVRIPMSLFLGPGRCSCDTIAKSDYVIFSPMRSCQGRFQASFFLIKSSSASIAVTSPPGSRPATGSELLFRPRLSAVLGIPHVQDSAAAIY